MEPFETTETNMAPSDICTDVSASYNAIENVSLCVSLQIAKTGCQIDLGGRRITWWPLADLGGRR